MICGSCHYFKMNIGHLLLLCIVSVILQGSCGRKLYSYVPYQLSSHSTVDSQFVKEKNVYLHPEKVVNNESLLKGRLKDSASSEFQKKLSLNEINTSNLNSDDFNTLETQVGDHLIRVTSQKESKNLGSAPKGGGYNINPKYSHVIEIIHRENKNEKQKPTITYGTAVQKQPVGHKISGSEQNKNSFYENFGESGIIEDGSQNFEADDNTDQSAEENIKVSDETENDIDEFETDEADSQRFEETDGDLEDTESELLEESGETEDDSDESEGFDDSDESEGFDESDESEGFDESDESEGFDDSDESEGFDDSDESEEYPDEFEVDSEDDLEETEDNFEEFEDIDEKDSDETREVEEEVEESEDGDIDTDNFEDDEKNVEEIERSPDDLQVEENSVESGPTVDVLFNANKDIKNEVISTNRNETSNGQIPTDKESLFNEQFEGSGEEFVDLNNRNNTKTGRILAGMLSRRNETFPTCTTQRGEPGHCRRLNECLLSEALSNFNGFLQQLCLIRGALVGICCPDNPVIETVNPDDNETKELAAEDLVQPPEGCGLNTKTRIVGGSISVPHEWTWMVALMRRNRFYCGGVIINNWYILTAAHCVMGMNVKDLTVRLGEYDFNEQSKRTEDLSVSEIKRHAQFVTLTFQHDIALLKLKRSIKYSKYVGSICLPEQKARDYSDVKGTVVGWGTVSFGGAASPILRQVTIPVWKNEDCDKTYMLESIGDSFMCAGAPEKGEDACQGDSGGPLMTVNESGRWEVIGLVSWGRRCGDPTYPGVYTRVTTYLDWIKQNAV